MELLWKTFCSNISVKTFKRLSRTSIGCVKEQFQQQCNFLSSKTNNKESFSLVPACSCSVMSHECLSGCPARSEEGRGAKISVVIEVSNKKESSITYFSSPKIYTNITEGFQQLLNLPSWYCKRFQLLKSTTMLPLHVVSTWFVRLLNKLGKGTRVKNLPLCLVC